MLKRILVAACFVFLSTAYGAELSVAPFSQWNFSGSGSHKTGDVLEITAEGGTSTWRSPQISLEPGACYFFKVSQESTDTDQGCLPCGIGKMSRDFAPSRDQWKEESFYFRNQDDVKESFFRVGQWESKGTFRFRDPVLTPVEPVWKECDFFIDGKKATLRLGEGETLRDGAYRFSAMMYGKSGNIHRPLHFSDATFNSNRWCINGEEQVMYDFQLQAERDGVFSVPFAWDGANIRLGVCHYAGNAPGILEASRNGQSRWSELGKIDKVGTHDFSLPELAFPLDRIFLRIRGVAQSVFQVDSLVFEAPLRAQDDSFALDDFSASGETLFAERIGGDSAAEKVEFSLTGNREIRARVFSDVNPPQEKRIPLEDSASPGKRELRFSVANQVYRVMLETHPLHRSDYGYGISDGEHGSTWWAEADWKISRTRAVPEPQSAKPIEITAAKNDFEAFQIVVKAPQNAPIQALKGTRSPLKGPGEAVIAPENIEVLYAYYHFVHSKTDETGLVDDWPDALPPFEKPIDVPPGKNQPVWIQVKVPPETPPGSYRGEIHLQSGDRSFSQTIPYTLKVWDFALPRENHHETAFGFSPHLAALYHNAKTEEEKRRVNEMYLQSFSDHRISIYNPTPYDGFSVKWLPDENDGKKSRCEIDFRRYDSEMSRVLEKFHFTNFTVPGHGLGGGTFHARSEPSLNGYAVDTEQYDAMMKDYYSKLVAHLKEKDWLGKTYVYWFDEPGKHDYEFVAQGTARLRHYAPELSRMMTLMMKDRGFFEEMEKIGTTLDIWCPVSYGLDEELARERMEKGERFWWYICTGPKAPYCTLFIDHPATELRVWYLQAWERNVVGSLIWQSNYWNSETAFPDSHQNPYEDPMGYVVGYSTPSGTKQHWGNGDGRFLYPPLSAAVPGMNGGEVVLEKPVSSIRWEMIREGVEDYEMLFMLRELLQSKGDSLSETQRGKAEELLRIPDTITKTLTDFTIDPRPVLQHREAIGNMIETLQKR